MSNFHEMAPEQLFEKISDFKNMNDKMIHLKNIFKKNLKYIILKHVVWRFRIYNYFCEIFKFAIL